MGKKRIIKKSGRGLDQGRKDRAMAKATKRHIEKGILHIEATFNNTKAVLTDEQATELLNFSGVLKKLGPRSPR